jgi:uncharacterized membrane protein YdjX (TVP38/TMEM64 family)
MQTLVLSRKFWAAAVSLVLICLGAFIPRLPDLSQPVTDLAVLISAYICGTAIEGKNPVPVEDALHSLIRSRKFWASLVGLAILLLRALVPDFPIPDEQISAIILTLSAYIFGTGLQDGLTKNTAA